MGLSRRAYAKHRGVSEKAVRKAIETGRILVEPDGSIDVLKADQAWEHNTDPARKKAAKQGADPVRTSGEGPHPRRSAPPAQSAEAPGAAEPGSPPDIHDAREAVTLIRRVLLEEGRTVDMEKSISFDDVRVADGIMKIRRAAIELQKDNRELLPRAQVVGHIEEAFANFRKELLGLPPRVGAQMAAEIGCDVAVLDRVLTRVIGEHLEQLSAPVVAGAG